MDALTAESMKSQPAAADQVERRRGRQEASLEGYRNRRSMPARSLACRWVAACKECAPRASRASRQQAFVMSVPECGRRSVEPYAA